MTIPIHAERASRENRDDKKRYRAKTFEEERIFFEG